MLLEQLQSEDNSFKGPECKIVYSETWDILNANVFIMVYNHLHAVITVFLFFALISLDSRSPFLRGLLCLYRSPEEQTTIYSIHEWI